MNIWIYLKNNKNKNKERKEKKGQESKVMKLCGQDMKLKRYE